jgi:hypothetical protein
MAKFVKAANGVYVNLDQITDMHLMNAPDGAPAVFEIHLSNGRKLSTDRADTAKFAKEAGVQLGERPAVPSSSAMRRAVQSNCVTVGNSSPAR